MTAGIIYERTGKHYDQSPFKPFEADLLAVDRAPTTHIGEANDTWEKRVDNSVGRLANLAISSPFTSHTGNVLVLKPLFWHG